MRRLLFLFVPLAACSTALNATSPGVVGAPLAGTLVVHANRDGDETPIAGATVEAAGMTATTDANGVASFTTTMSSVDVHVTAPGFVSERWIGVDREQAWITMVPPTLAQTLAGTISGGGGDAVVSAATSLSMLRVSTTLGTTASCPGGACDVSLTVETSGAAVDVVIVDASSARLASRVRLDGSGHFAIDGTSLPSTAHLVTMQATLPSTSDLQAVVGVPGLATSYGVAFFPSFTPSAINLVAPSIDGPLAGARLWYVAYGTSADGHGQSMIFDRHVGADGVAHLPASFLAIPSAAASSGSVGIDVDPEVDLYVVETLAADASSERAIVLHPAGAHVDVTIPVGSTQTFVRAIDTDAPADGFDLLSAEADATRIATLTL